MVKNVFTENEEEPSRTHDITYLLEQAVEQGWLNASEEVMRAAVRLTSFAVMARYEFSRDITGAEALLATEDCNTIARLLKNAGYCVVSINSDIAVENDQ